MRLQDVIIFTISLCIPCVSVISYETRVRIFVFFFLILRTRRVLRHRPDLPLLHNFTVQETEAQEGDKLVRAQRARWNILSQLHPSGVFAQLGCIYTACTPIRGRVRVFLVLRRNPPAGCQMCRAQGSPRKRFASGLPAMRSQAWGVIWPSHQPSDHRRRREARPEEGRHPVTRPRVAFFAFFPPQALAGLPSPILGSGEAPGPPAHV